MLSGCERRLAPEGAATAPLRVLALSGHAIENAGARYRVFQFVRPLAMVGIDMRVESFFGPTSPRDLHSARHVGAKAWWAAAATFRRGLHLLEAGRYDVLLVHNWVHPVRFPPFDALLRRLRTPIVYDIDDAYYGPVGSLADRFRDPGWTHRLARVATMVVAGSQPIRAALTPHSRAVEVLPTAVDIDRFRPRDGARPASTPLVVGWVGSPWTARHLEFLFPVLTALARHHAIVVRLVGVPGPVRIPGVVVECPPWQLEHEVEYFRQLDVGLYPLGNDSMSRAKHGFKLNLYRAVGVPAVASAHGAHITTVRHGEDVLLARSPEDWYAALDTLLGSAARREEIGGAGRRYVERHLSLQSGTARLAAILRGAADPAGLSRNGSARTPL